MKTIDIEIQKGCLRADNQPRGQDIVERFGRLLADVGNEICVLFSWYTTYSVQ